MLDSFIHEDCKIPLSQINLIVGETHTGKSKFIQRIEGHLYKNNVHKVLFYDNPWVNLHHTSVHRIVEKLFEVCKRNPECQAFIVSQSYDVFRAFLFYGHCPDSPTSQLLKFSRDVAGKFYFDNWQNSQFVKILQSKNYNQFR